MPEVEEKSTASYPTKPTLDKKFPPESVRTIIQTILHDELKGKKYDQHMAGQWTRQISDKIKKSIKDLDYPRYKLVVQVLFCEQKNEGVRFCSKCLWDPEADNYTSYTYSNDSFFCTAAVFATYFY